MESMDLRPTSVPRIVFPEHWRSGSNVHAQDAAATTLAWMKSHGMGQTPAEERRLRKFCCGQYSGYALPHASYPRYLLMTEFLTLWLFWDDYEVETEQGIAVDELVAAITGERLPAGASRYAAAWYDLGRRLRQTQSRDWIERLGQTMRHWLLVSRLEAERAREQRRSHEPMALDNFLSRRVITIGMYPTFHLIEYTEGCELGELHNEPVVKTLKLLAARLVALGNDLMSLGKDLAQAWPNVVTVLSAQQGIPMREAFARVVALHQSDIARFDTLAERLLSAVGRNSAVGRMLRRWLQAVRHSVHGFALWESTAARYREAPAVVDGELLWAPLGYEGDALPEPAQDEAPPVLVPICDMEWVAAA
jgi:terpene synthase-like protein